MNRMWRIVVAVLVVLFPLTASAQADTGLIDTGGDAIPNLDTGTADTSLDGDTTSDAGSDDATGDTTADTTADTGEDTSGGDDTGTSEDTGPSEDTGMNGGDDAGDVSSDAGGDGTSEEGGCGCTAASAGSMPGSLALLLVVALGVRLLRRTS